MLGSEVKRKIHGKSTDRYWPLIGQEAKGFVRTRRLDEETNVLTVKVKDRDSNINRKEIDIYTTDPHNKLVQFCRSLAGKEHGSLEKEYYVYWPTSEELPNISVYHVTGDDTRVFIEVEAKSVDDLGDWIEKINRVFDFETHEASGSLYEMYILKSIIKETNRE